MNVLILTPDAVGSTLLQRLITIYMQFHHYDRPVINLHELTNGLVKYHNEKFNQDVLGKKEGKWGYYQSLQEVVDLLSSVDHYKTSRLAHYHIRNRQDSMADQVPFYQYLNDNFYIISCRRHNLFEHSLSWCISKITKKLNVYSSFEKVDSFFDIYQQGIDLDPNSLIQTLNAYKDYVTWCNNHFNVASYFFYEEHLPRIEQYILNLPIFAQQTQQLTWKDNFDMSFDQWNLCHYLNSDLGSLALNQPEKLQQLANHAAVAKLTLSETKFIQGYNDVADPSWPRISSMADYQQLPESVRHEVEQVRKITLPVANDSDVKVDLSLSLPEFLPAEHQEFLSYHKKNYNNSQNVLHDMCESGVLVSAPPIKKQTLAEKKHIVRNYQHLLDVYNQWIEQNPELGQPLTDQVLDQFADIEKSRWNPVTSAVALSSAQSSD